MPAIHLLPPDLQNVSVTAPDASSPNSTSGGGSSGDSSFGAVLSSVTSSSDNAGGTSRTQDGAAIAPPAADKAAPTKDNLPPAQPPAASGADHGADDKTNRPADPQASPPADGNQQPRQATPADVKPAPSARPATGRSAGSVKSNVGEPATAQLLPQNAPVELVAKLLLVAIDSAGPANVRPGDAPQNSPSDSGPPPAADAQTPAPTPPPALIAALNSAVNLVPTNLAAAPVLPADLPRSAAAKSNTTSTAQIEPGRPAEIKAVEAPPAGATTVVAAATAATAATVLAAALEASPPVESAPRPIKTDSTVDARSPGNESRAATGATAVATAAAATVSRAIADYSPLPAEVTLTASPQVPATAPQAPTGGGHTEPPGQANNIVLPTTALVAQKPNALPEPSPNTTAVSPSIITSAATGSLPVAVPQSLSATTADKGTSAPLTISAASTSGPDSGTPAPSSADVANSGFAVFAAAPASLQNHVATHAIAEPGGPAGFNPAQVIEQVAYALKVTHASGQEMQLHLNPPELGALQVDVSLRDGVLSARLEAQTPTTQQLLVDNLPQLKVSLSQQGVAFDRIDVQLAGSQTGSGGSGSAGQPFGRQPEGDTLWDQARALAQTEGNEAARTGAASRGSVSRNPLTSLDVMA